MNTPIRVAATLSLVVLLGGGGYWAGTNDLGTQLGLRVVEPALAIPAASMTAPTGAIIYYRHPDGLPQFSAMPTNAEGGRPFVAVHASEDVSFVPTAPKLVETEATVASAGTTPAKGKLLYYRNPMGLPDTSKVPKKDSMGMDYIPVYAGEGGDTVPGTVNISPERIQMLGVRTEAAALRSMAHTVRAVGIVAADERRIGVVNPKFEGWIEQLHVNTTGETVRRGEALLEVYSPDLVLAQREYLVARSAATDMAHADAMARETISPERIQMLGVRTEAASLAPHAFAPAARPPERGSSLRRHNRARTHRADRARSSPGDCTGFQAGKEPAPRVTCPRPNPGNARRGLVKV